MAAYQAEVGPLVLVSDPVLQLPHLPEQVGARHRGKGLSRTAASTDFNRNPGNLSSLANTVCNTARPTSTSSPACSKTRASSISSSRPRTSTPWCWRTIRAHSSPARTKPKPGIRRLSGGRLDEDTVVFTRRGTQSATTGTASHTDYDFEKPNTSLFATLAGSEKAEVLRLSRQSTPPRTMATATPASVWRSWKWISTVRGKATAWASSAAMQVHLGRSTTATRQPGLHAADGGAPPPKARIPVTVPASGAVRVRQPISKRFPIRYPSGRRAAPASR
jgi:hypothetical protein